MVRERSQYVGIIMGSTSGKIYAVVNPDSDRELDDPKFLLMRSDLVEPVEMQRVQRSEYMKLRSIHEVAALVRRKEHTDTNDFVTPIPSESDQ